MILFANTLSFQILFGGWASNLQIPWKEVETKMFALNVVSASGYSLHNHNAFPTVIVSSSIILLLVS